MLQLYTNSNHFNLDNLLKLDDLKDVQSTLWDARAKWRDIGRCIGVDEGTLDTMKGKDSAYLRPGSAYICQYLIPNIMLYISAPEHAMDINYASSQSPTFTLPKKLITLINHKI